MDPTRPRPGIPLLAGVGLLVATVGIIVLASASTPDDGGAATTSVTAGLGEALPRGYESWAQDEAGDPLRWDACAPVPFVVNTDGAPDGAVEDLRAALELLADASGLELILAGTTDERPMRERPLVERAGTTWRWRPVLVAWAGPDEGDLPLTPLDRGIALPVAVRDGDLEAFVTGQVVINVRRTDLRAGFDDRSDSLGALLVHEVAHVLGLDHVDDPGELMWVDPGSGPVVLGPGDRAGLRTVGADAGCRGAPDPTVGRGLDVTR